MTRNHLKYLSRKRAVFQPRYLIFEKTNNDHDVKLTPIYEHNTETYQLQYTTTMKKLEGRSLIPEDIDLITNESVIDIDGGYDTPSDMKLLSTAILRSTTLHRLQLHYFSFTIPEFITALCHSGCTLRILHLYNNKLSVEDAQQLGVVLKTNRSIDTIIMEKCDISCEAAEKLAEGLRDNSTLRTMNLWDNNIGCVGATSLAEALMVFS